MVKSDINAYRDILIYIFQRREATVLAHGQRVREGHCMWTLNVQAAHTLIRRALVSYRCTAYLRVTDTFSRFLLKNALALITQQLPIMSPQGCDMNACIAPTYLQPSGPLLCEVLQYLTVKLRCGASLEARDLPSPSLSANPRLFIIADTVTLFAAHTIDDQIKILGKRARQRETCTS